MIALLRNPKNKKNVNAQSSTCIKSSFKWDNLAIIITIVFDAILLSMVIAAFRSSLVLIEIFSILLAVSCALFFPIRLIVTDDTIKIRRPIGTVKVDINDILSCCIIEDEKQFFDKVIRTCGSGGAYGYWGYFRHSKYGKMRFFVTHRQQCFHIKLKDGKHYVISSEKRDEIVRFIANNSNCHGFHEHKLP